MPTYRPGMTIIGRFEIKARLGAGAMGIVFGAVDRKLNEDVALKFLPPAMAEDDEAVRQFAGEVRRARRVSGPFILRVYDMWDDGEGGHFVTMEWAKGGDLKSFRLSRGLLSWEETRSLMIPVLKGLQSVHDAGIVHRDVKPGNILFREDQTPVVADFGISKTIMASMSRISQDGSISGTPAYMAPEAIQGTMEVGFSTDLYAVGCMAYELLVGHTPFHGDAMSVMYSQANIDPSFEALSPTAARWIGACLIKDANYRVKTANELVRGLDDPFRLPEYVPVKALKTVQFRQPATSHVSISREVALQTPDTGISSEVVERASSRAGPSLVQRLWNVLVRPNVLPWALGIVLVVLIVLVVNASFDLGFMTRWARSRESESPAQPTNEAAVAGPESYGSEHVLEPSHDATVLETDTEIRALEKEARRLFSELKFTSGSDGNAWDICTQILEIDPGNSVCRQLIEDMKTRYRGWVETSLSSGDCDKAASYAAALRRIGDTTDYKAKIDECRDATKASSETIGICPYCGEPTVEGKFCTVCGENIEDLTVVCPRCLKWTTDEKFCIHCRQRLK